MPKSPLLLFIMCLVSYSPGSVYGFNVNVNKTVQQLAAKKNIPIKLHKIIYHLVEDLKEELNSKLTPITEEIVKGILSFYPTSSTPNGSHFQHFLHLARVL